MMSRVRQTYWLLVLGLAVIAAAPAYAQRLANDDEFPYSIMAPEPGTAAAHHRHGTAGPARDRGANPPRASLLGREKFVSKLHRRPDAFVTRGSSGSVLPTPLPRTRLIPPEGGGTLTTHAFPQEQGPTVVPGLANPVPNLAHGPESFQDRASRCAFQGGLYNVPGAVNSQYIGGCVQ